MVAVIGGLQAEGQANYSPNTTVILCVHLLCFALQDYTKSYCAEGMAAKISRSELIKTKHQYEPGLAHTKVQEGPEGMPLANELAT